MTQAQVKEILERALDWPHEDQETLAQIAEAIERTRNAPPLTPDEWRIVRERAERRDLVSDEEAKALFARYKSP